MKINVGPDLMETLKLAYHANRPVLLSGPTGVGKSECIEQAAAALGIDCIVRDLSLMEGPDLTGLPVTKNGRTEYATPSFLPAEGDGGGFLVFEEVNRAPRYVQTPCMQLLTARRFNDYVLPTKWLPAAAINPYEDGEYCGVEEMDKALVARFMVLDVRADVKCWLAWAEANGVHPAVREFVRSTPKIFEAPQSNPRAWSYASQVLSASEGGKFSRNTLLAGIAGLVGDKLAATFLKTYRARGSGVPSAKKVLNSYSTIQSQVQRWKKGGDTAKLNALLHQVLLHLQDPSNEARAKRNTKAKANLRKLYKDFPAELRRLLGESVPWLLPKNTKTKRRCTA